MNTSLMKTKFYQLITLYGNKPLDGRGEQSYSIHEYLKIDRKTDGVRRTLQ